MPSTSAAFTLSTAQSSAMTVYLYHELENGQQRLQRTTGLRGNFDISLEVGQEASAAFSGKGRYVDFLSDEAQYFDATTKLAALLADGVTPVTARTTGVERYALAAPIMVSGATVTVGGQTWCLSSFTFGTNWTLHEKRCASASPGTLEDVKLTRGPGQRAGGEFVLDTDDTAVIDAFVDAWELATELSFSITLTEGTGASGSATITIEAPKAQIGAPSPSDQGGFTAFTIPYFVNGDYSDAQADDDITITFAAVP